MIVAGKGTVLHQAQRGGKGQRQLGCLWVTEVGGIFPPQVPYAVVFIIASFYSGETGSKRWSSLMHSFSLPGTSSPF